MGTSFPNSYKLTDQGKEYSNLFSEKRALVRKQRAQQNKLNKKNNWIQWILNQ